jgi:hypothetical protein
MYVVHACCLTFVIIRKFPTEDFLLLSLQFSLRGEYRRGENGTYMGRNKQPSRHPEESKIRIPTTRVNFVRRVGSRLVY